MAESRILKDVKTHLEKCRSGYGSIEWKNNTLIIDILEPSVHEIHQGIKCTEAEFDRVVDSAEMNSIFRIWRHADEVGLKMSSYRIVWRFI